MKFGEELIMQWKLTEVWGHLGVFVAPVVLPNHSHLLITFVWMRPLKISTTNFIIHVLVSQEKTISCVFVSVSVLKC